MTAIALDVQDDGKGITPEKLSQIQAQGSGWASEECARGFVSLMAR